MKTITELAREAGASPYKNRHFPDRPFHTFSPEQLQTFAALVEAAQLERLLAGVEMPEPDTHCWDSDTESDVWSYSKGQLRETVASAVAKKDAEIDTLKAENERLREALKFYAEKEHFVLGDEDAWDTVSGEPKNYWCDEAGTATVEDGSVAHAAMKGQP